MTIEYTENRHYPKPDFDTRTWHQQMHDFEDMVDSDIVSILGQGGVFLPAWQSGRAYLLGDRIWDVVTQNAWHCIVAHTSSGSTFAAYRELNPTHWAEIGLVFVPRGVWANSTSYGVLDHVYDTTEGVSAVCLIPHVSAATGTIRDADPSYWGFIVDIQDTITEQEKFQLILGVQIFS